MHRTSGSAVRYPLESRIVLTDFSCSDLTTRANHEFPEAAVRSAVCPSRGESTEKAQAAAILAVLRDSFYLAARKMSRPLILAAAILAVLRDSFYLAARKMSRPLIRPSQRVDPSPAKATANQNSGDVLIVPSRD